MRYAYRRFNHYEELVHFLNVIAREFHWSLHSWQDVGGGNGVDIRVLFSQDTKAHTDELPAVEP